MQPDFTFAVSFSLAVTIFQVGALRLIDLNEKEPIWALLLMIWLGAVSAALAALIVDPGLLDPSGPTIALASGVAKTVAIAAGFYVLVRIDRRRGWSELNGIVDALIYGTAVGMGFATAEVLLRETYSATAELQTPTQDTLWELIWIVLQVSLAQGFLGALIGGGFGLLRFRHQRRWLVFAPLAALLLAVGLHLAYGWLALDGYQVGPDATKESVAAAILLAGAALLVFLRGLREESGTIVAELEREARSDPEVVFEEELKLFRRRRSRYSRHLDYFMRGEVEELLRDRALRDRQVQLALARRAETDAASDREAERWESQARNLRAAIRKARERHDTAARSTGWATRALVGSFVAVLAIGGVVAFVVTAGPQPPLGTITSSALFERGQEELKQDYERPIRAGILQFVGPWRLTEVEENEELIARDAQEAYDIEYQDLDGDALRYTIAGYTSGDAAEGALDLVTSETGAEELGWINGRVATLIRGSSEGVSSFCGSLPLPGNRKPPNRLDEFKLAVVAALGEGWNDAPGQRFPVRFVRENAQGAFAAQVAGLSTPLVGATSLQFARSERERIAKFPGYRELDFRAIDLDFAANGFQRTYEYLSDDFGLLREVRVYVSECGTAYSFYAAARTEDFDDFEAAFDRAFESL